MLPAAARYKHLYFLSLLCSAVIEWKSPYPLSVPSILGSPKPLFERGTKTWNYFISSVMGLSMGISRDRSNRSDGPLEDSQMIIHSFT